MNKIEVEESNSFLNMSKLFLPILFSNILNVAIQIMNGIWVGQMIGEHGLAIITNAFPITMISSAISTGFVTSVVVLLSQNYSEKNEDKIKSIIKTAYFLVLIMGMIVSILIFASLPLILNVLGTPVVIVGDVIKYVRLYMVVYILSFLFLFLNESIRALGNNRVPLIFIAIEVVFNIVLVPTMIRFGFGILGVAIANIISIAMVLMILYCYIIKFNEILKFNKKIFLVNKEMFHSIVNIAIPIIVELWLVSILISVETWVSNKSGIVGSATYGVVSRLEQIFYAVGQSLQAMGVIIVGRAISSKNQNKVRVAVFRGIMISTIPSVVILVLLVFLPENICSIFTNSNEILITAKDYLSIVMIAYILMPYRLFFNGFVIGTSHTKYLFINSLVASIVEIVVMFILLKHSDVKSLHVLGIGISTYVVVNMILNICFYFSRIWRKSEKYNV